MCTISLPVLNILAWVLHAINALLILCFTVFGVVVERRNVITTTYQYTTWNNGTLAQEYVDAYDIHISWLMFAFSALSWGFQMYAGFFLPNYIGYFSKGRRRRQIAQTHPLRFVEYAISAPIMFVGISLLSGIRNAHLLAALAVLVSVTMGCGLVAEYALEKSMNGDNGMYVVAWIAHLTGWLGVSTAYGILFATTNIVLNSGVSEGPPAFVWVIIIFQFLAFMSFGFVQFAQLLIRDVDTERAEQAYIMLSLIAKTQLTWNIFFSVLVDV